MKTVLHIEGMSCAHCVQHVRKALESIIGVNSAEVSLEAKSATVDHGNGVSLDALKAAVEEEGYEVKY